MALHPYWSGQIRLSLVSLRVNIYPAINRPRQVALCEIYRPTGACIHHQNVVDGEVINLMDALRKSLSATEKAGKSSSKLKTKSTSAHKKVKPKKTYHHRKAG